MPFIRQEATLWKPFNNKMTLLYSFPKVGLWGIPPLDESSRNPTKILRVLKHPRQVLALKEAISFLAYHSI